MNNQDKKWGDFKLFATVFAAIFGLVYALQNRNKPKQELQKSGSQNMQDITAMLTEFARCFSNIQPFLNFEDVFKHLKEFDESKNAVKAGSYLDDQIAESEMMWKRIHDIDLMYSGLSLNINTKEPEDLQKTKEQLSKFWQLPGMLKNIFVVRGKILRFIKKMVLAGKQPTAKTAKDAKELTDLMHEFNGTKNLAQKEVEGFDKMMKSLNRY
ncbi:hypothetical protein KGQ34_00715 [Patescibacteria group bacterium]|nr:hypothetical protein [Patescibacteria group bacterium]